MMTDTLPMLIISGALTGGIYGLLAMGLSLQYGVAHVLNIAHGDFVMLGAMFTWLLYSSLGINPLIAAAIISPVLFIIGFVLQTTLFKALRTQAAAAFEGSALLAAFGLAYIISYLALMEFGARPRTSYYLNYMVTFAGISIRFNRIIGFAIAVAIGVAVYLFLTRSRLGRAIRATAEDPASAELMGVNTNMILAFCFGLGSLLAGVAGSLIAMTSPVSTVMGFRNTVVALIVVVMGGLGSVPGSFIAGIIVGIVATLVTGLWQPVLVVPVYYAILMILLLVKPSGLLGKK